MTTFTAETYQNEYLPEGGSDVNAPAPNFSRDQPLIAPRINAEVIPPAPNVSQRSTLVAPALVLAQEAVRRRDPP